MSVIQRRTLLQTGTALAAAAVATLTNPGPAAARAPRINKQAPGFYRMKVGAFEVTVISDGTIAFPPGLWNAPQDQVLADLTKDDQSTVSVPFQLNTMVVDTGDALLLIDTGTGGKLQNTSGALLANLAAAGLHPREIDAVVFTHLHPDHLWGLTDERDRALLFPNASLVVSEAELAYWSAATLPGAVSGLTPQQAAVTRSNLMAAASRFERIKAGAELLPGIRTLDTRGHTPGHMSIHIGSNNEALLVAGDVVANATLSFRNPSWGYGFDVDQAMAATTRAAFLDYCAADKVLVANYHLPFPAIGHVARDGSAYRWLPADWLWTA